MKLYAAVKITEGGAVDTVTLHHSKKESDTQLDEWVDKYPNSDVVKIDANLGRLIRMGSMTPEQRQKCRENGKLGGRPKKGKKDERKR